jgi:hypothetical protein
MEPTLPSALATATKLVSKFGTAFTPQPSGTAFLGIQTFPSGAVRADTRTFLSTLRCAGASPVSSGALLLDSASDDSYLASAITQTKIAGVVQTSELTLLKTNSSVTVKRVTAGAWASVATAVKCAILNQPMTDQADKAAMIPNYRGTTPVMWGHFQTSVGVQLGDQVVDGSRTYLVSHDLNTTLMTGLVIARMELRT